MSSSPSPLSRASKGGKSGRGARSGSGARLLEERVENAHDRIGNTRRQRGPLLSSRQADLAAIWADVLVADRREEDMNKVTDNSPRGINRRTRNLAKNNGQAPERGRTL